MLELTTAASYKQKRKTFEKQCLKCWRCSTYQWDYSMAYWKNKQVNYWKGCPSQRCRVSGYIQNPGKNSMPTRNTKN